MSKQVSIAVPSEIIERVDAEAMRRKIIRNGTKTNSQDEIDEAMKIANSKGTVAANNYLRAQRTKRAELVSGSTSRHGIILELIIQAADSLPPLAASVKKQRSKKPTAQTSV